MRATFPAFAFRQSRWCENTNPLLLFQYIPFFIYGNARYHSVFIPQWVVRHLFIARYKGRYLSMPLSTYCKASKLRAIKQFKRYINGFGKRRLKQIRYKYFSDKAKNFETRNCTAEFLTCFLHHSILK